MKERDDALWRGRAASVRCGQGVYVGTIGRNGSLALREQDVHPLCAVCTEAGWSAGWPPGPYEREEDIELVLTPCGNPACNAWDGSHPYLARMPLSGPSPDALEHFRGVDDIPIQGLSQQGHY